MTPRFFGVEIEAIAKRVVDVDSMIRDMTAAGVACVKTGYTHQTMDVWKFTTDNSIQTHKPRQHAFELVSPKLSGEDGLRQVRVVCEVMKRYGVVVNNSCGMHVHHDTHDYKTGDFQSLFHLYCNSEKALDSVVSRTRRQNGNIFCKSLKNSNLPQTSRYYKLNLLAFNRHGTVEVRHHQGTVEAEKIINWVLLTQGMVERARRAVKPSNHDLTLYDVMQAAGLIHASKTDEMASAAVSYFKARREHFARETTSC